jgi:hypothetical protein
MWEERELFRWTSCLHQNVRKTIANCDSKCQVQYECLTHWWTEENWNNKISASSTGFSRPTTWFKLNPFPVPTQHILCILRLPTLILLTTSLDDTDWSLSEIHMLRVFCEVNFTIKQAAKPRGGEGGGEWRYCSTLFETCYKIEGCDQCHILAALRPEKRHSVHWYLRNKRINANFTL